MLGGLVAFVVQGLVQIWTHEWLHTIHNINDYMHRVGRATSAGVAISFVNPNEARWFEMIETHIGKKLPVYQAQNEEVLCLSNRVSVVKSSADEEMNNNGWRSGGYLGEEDVFYLCP